MRCTIIALVALMLWFHGAYAEDKAKKTEAIPAEYSKISEISLKVESGSATDGNRIVNVRLINPTSLSITFTGYSESSPWYRIQRWVDGNWVEHKVGWFCGTGLRECAIPAGASSVIPVNEKVDLFPLRVGVEYALDGKKQEQQVVWSEKIEKESFKKPDPGEGK